MIINESQKALLFIITQLIKLAQKQGTSVEILNLENGETYKITVERWTESSKVS